MVLRHLQIISGIVLSLFLFGCSDPKPIKIGFVGGISGRVADLGVAGRNGYQLAIEQINAQGGINGRPVQMLIRDDGQYPEQAIAAVNYLIGEKVSAIIGPMTSAMAMEVVPLANQHQTLMMGCTVTTDQLTGIDDYFLRTLASAGVHAAKMATYLRQHNLSQRAVVVTDLGNAAYANDWALGFNAAFLKQGGQYTHTETFFSSEDTNFETLAESIIQHQPDSISLVMNSVDAALLAKQLKSHNPEYLLIASEWAGTEHLIELGGEYVEGSFAPQHMNRDSQKPSYLKFYKEYKERFSSEPGFPSVVCYNATQVVLKALASSGSAPLKHKIINRADYAGLQGTIHINTKGDGLSRTFITRIQNGRFVVQE